MTGARNRTGRRRREQYGEVDHYSPDRSDRPRSNSPTPRDRRDRSNSDEDRQHLPYDEWDRRTTPHRRDERDDSHNDPDPDEALPSVEHDAAHLNYSDRFASPPRARRPNSLPNAVTTNQHERPSQIDVAAPVDPLANAAERQPQPPEDDLPSDPLYRIRKAAEESNLAFYAKPGTRKRATGVQVVYEGEDRKMRPADADFIGVANIYEIHEVGLTSDPNAYLGNGKTTSSSGGLTSSKTVRVLVTGGSSELRTGFRITSCNNKLQEKIDRTGEVDRYFLIHAERQPEPPNPSGLSILHITSWVDWLEVSAVDLENRISFLPSRIDRHVGQAHINDVERAVIQRSQQDIVGVSTLAREFEATQPYGPFPSQSTLSNSGVAHSAPPEVLQAVPQATTFYPPSGPRADLRRPDRLRTQPPPDYRGPGRQQREVRPAARATPEALTHPLPPRPSTPPQAQTDPAPQDDNNDRTPPQQHTETDQPGTNSANTKRKRVDSEEKPLKNGRRQSI